MKGAIIELTTEQQESILRETGKAVDRLVAYQTLEAGERRLKCYYLRIGDESPAISDGELAN